MYSFYNIYLIFVNEFSYHRNSTRKEIVVLVLQILYTPRGIRSVKLDLYTVKTSLFFSIVFTLFLFLFFFLLLFFSFSVLSLVNDRRSS